MKKLLKVIAFIAVMIMSASSAFAQFGIEAGYAGSRARLKNINFIGEDDVKTADALNGFYVGVNYNIKLIAGLSLQPGVNYEYLTGRLDVNYDNLNIGWLVNPSTRGSMHEHYLNIPLRLQYAFEILPVFKLFAYTGPTFSVGLAGSMFYGFETLDSKVDLKYDYYTGKLSLNDKILDIDDLPIYNRFDIKYGLGLGVELFNFIEIKGGYDWGLINRFKDPENPFNEEENNFLKNDRFYVAVAVRF